MAVSQSGTPLQQFGYEWDGSKNITSITNNSTTDTFGYDALNRIGTETQGDESRGYSYDANGNRASMGSGKLFGLKNAEYTYDSLSRLTKAAGEGIEVGYSYNGDGLLYERTSAGKTTRYYYDEEAKLIAEAEVAGGTPKMTYVYIYDLSGRIWARKDLATDQLQYFHLNGHGDVVGLSDSSGKTLNQYSYDIWGGPLTAEETVPNVLRYAGEYWDDTTGLQYLRARWYDPSMGRFMGEDTYQGEIANPLTLNWYTYVSNNPLKYVDPSGHREEWGSGGSGGDSFSFWENEWYLLKQSHSSVYSTIDFWTYGSMAQLNEYYRVSQENPYSLEHFLQAGLIVIDIVPAPVGKGTKQVASLTEDGAKYVNNAISKALRECNCFAAGTKVQTDEGEQNIEDIKVGDMVLAKDENNPDGELGYKEVTALYRNQRDDIIKLHVGEQVIETTDNHPFWVEGKGWIFADELQVGDKLQKADGSNLTIDKVEFVKLDKPITVYNFTVADFHTYYVTNLGIWVHNTDCPMFGANGVQTTSKTIWKENGSKARIDVENPNPGQRPGQIHYQDANNKKFLFDPQKGGFVDSDGNLAPKSVNKMLEDSNFVKKLNVGLTQYLGENPYTP